MRESERGGKEGKGRKGEKDELAARRLNRRREKKDVFWMV